MNTNSIKFAFGGAFGANGRQLRHLKEEYSDLCLQSTDWFANVPTSEEGHGWLELPDIDTDEIKNVCHWLGTYDAVIHVGIGGSALGNLMLHQAIMGDYFNGDSAHPEFYLADNPDPSKIRAIWDRVAGKRVALVGVSKSGSTAETMSQFLWYRDMLAKTNKDVDKDILVITDPRNGIFRAFANAVDCRALDLPPSVGGRYSALCPSGLYSACILGIDIDALLSGARAMRDSLLHARSFSDNPAMILSALSVFHENHGRPMTVLMPYSSKMSYFAEWFAQLWGESLGKCGKGSTPIRALGAIDQHSQVQLYTEGPDDKFFTIINIADHGDKVIIPSVSEPALSPLTYMDGIDVGHMLSLEAQSTAAAILKAGHPVVWIEVERLDEWALGSLIFFYEYMTAMTGRIMSINPFNQPGVEQGKKYTYGLMGRAQYEKDADEATEWFKLINRETVSL